MAVRLPEPVTTKAILLLGDQPGRLETSCMMAERSGVRCASPLSPIEVHALGLQDTAALVVVRDETLLAVSVNGLASAVRSAVIRRSVLSVVSSSVVNWMYELVMSAPWGMSTEKRRPTTCWSSTSLISSRSLLSA